MLHQPLSSETDYLRLAFTNRPSDSTWIPAFIGNCGIENVLGKLDDETKDMIRITVVAFRDEATIVSLLRALYGHTGLPKARPILYAQQRPEHRLCLLACAPAPFHGVLLWRYTGVFVFPLCKFPRLLVVGRPCRSLMTRAVTKMKTFTTRHYGDESASTPKGIFLMPLQKR